MCDFSPVWGWLAAVLVAIGGVVSSAIFAAAWSNSGPLVYIAYIGLGATALWAAIAIGLCTSLSSGLTNYCSCVNSKGQACQTLCNNISFLVNVLSALLSAIVVLVAVMLIAGPNAPLVIALTLAVLALAGLAIAILVMAAQLSGCQPAPATTPSSPKGPTPPTGTGPVPI